MKNALWGKNNKIIKNKHSGKNARLHPIVEERIRLLHVDDVQFDVFIFGGILYAKVEPLGVSFCIEVILQN